MPGTMASSSSFYRWNRRGMRLHTDSTVRCACAYASQVASSSLSGSRSQHRKDEAQFLGISAHVRTVVVKARRAGTVFTGAEVRPFE